VNKESDLDNFLAEELEDPESRTRFEEIAPLVSFGCAVAIAREERRMSIQALAAATGINRAMLVQIEKGNDAPALVAQTKIARALNARLEISPSGRIDFVLYPQVVQRRVTAHMRTATMPDSIVKTA